MLLISFTLFLVSLPLVNSILGYDQSAGAFGVLTCNGKPAGGVLVKLYDLDRGDIDDLLAKTYTNPHGVYKLEGWTDEFTTIDPMLNFYHDCNNDIPFCKRKFRIHIPDQYVSKGRVAERYFDGGELELSGRFPGESIDCFHYFNIKASSSLSLSLNRKNWTDTTHGNDTTIE